jgi:hypothetical protein
MPTRLIAALLAAGLMLSGCQSGDAAETAAIEPEGSAVEQQENTPAPEPDSADEVTPEAPAIVLGPCDEINKAAIDATIGAQTQAFRDGDFDAAYALASPSFQAGIPIDLFSSLIRSSYSQLLTADNARSGSCEADVVNGVATILVRFETSSDPAYTLRYVMELVEGQWRISGANQESVAETVA